MTVAAELEAPLSIASLQIPEILANPYPFYARLRTEAPILRDPVGVRVISRYADVHSVISQPHVSVNRLDELMAFRPDRADARVRALFACLKRQMVFLDPPQHTRLRNLVNKAFTPSQVERMRAKLEQKIDELLDRAVASDEMDVMRDLAVPLPVAIIGQLLGVPDSDLPRLKAWSEDWAAFLGGSIGLSVTQMAAVARGMEEFVRYFHDLWRERRAHPGDDLLTALMSAEDSGDHLDREDLCANCALLIAAGHETTTNLIGNGLLALLRHPQELQRLREQPDLMPAAVEELLRFDGAVQLSARRATAPFDLAGERINKGEILYLVLGAANRDPERFQSPDQLDISRSNNRHLAFGHGPHYCLGGPLARLEAQLTLTALLSRIGEIRLLDPQPRFRSNATLRGLESLRIGFRRA